MSEATTASDFDRFGNVYASAFSHDLFHWVRIERRGNRLCVRNQDKNEWLPIATIDWNAAQKEAIVVLRRKMREELDRLDEKDINAMCRC